MEKSINFVVIDFIGTICCIRSNFMVEEQREGDVQAKQDLKPLSIKMKTTFLIQMPT